ncbi:MAG TPA: HD domain-containing phosphohydrolase [Bryobacteraceae bacterium]|nr:HD domain-containing phosphohydrolase [Bryobacteraceae bacterium]
MRPLSTVAKTYIAMTALVGAFVLAGAVWGWQPGDALRGAFYLAGAVAASQLKVRVPGVTGTLSMNFLFVLIGVIELPLAETLALACAGMAAQFLWEDSGRPAVLRVVFHLSSVTLAAASAWAVFHSAWVSRLDHTLPVLLFFSTAAYFLVNTLSVSLMIALTENRRVGEVWRQGYLWTAPEHLVGAALAALFHAANAYLGWQMAVLTVPAAYLVYRSYHLYLHRLEEEKKHATDMAQMHWRTIEALALAIEAKDNTTHAHLQRVLVYATEVGREIGLSEAEQRALEIAALLHDIGKMAVPEQILSKPARLTLAEFERLKIHPAVGAEILERVGFPYPVVPIVRAHHEKWDGTGYPAGLKGTEIPIGARILAAVDCLDALTSPRPYRRALPLDLALEYVVSESGKSFDPKVVEVLRRRCLELENLTRLMPAAKVPAFPKCEAGGAPAAGYEQVETAEPENGAGGDAQPNAHLETARQEFQSLLELTGELGDSMTRDEILWLAGALLRRLIPHDTLAIFVCREETLVPEFVEGEECRMFSSLRIPMGRGISGWVVEKRKAVLNGDPAVEWHHLEGSWPPSALLSALAAPLIGPAGVMGSVGLYHREADHFTREHLRVLVALGWALGHIVDQAMRLGAKDGVPGESSLNPRRLLSLHLEREVMRCRRTRVPLAVVVLEVEGIRAIRERLGHLVDERVMQATLQALRHHCRDYDYAGRLEETSVGLVLPGLSRQAAQKRLADLREAALAAARKVCADPQPSIEVGVAIFPDDAADPEALLGQARGQSRRGCRPAPHALSGGEIDLNAATRLVQ